MSRSRSLTLTLSPELDAPHTARAVLAALLPHWRVDADLIERALLVASELVASVVVAGEPSDPVHLTVDLRGDSLSLCVTDREPCLPAPRDEQPSPPARGLQLVAALASWWTSESCAGGGRRVQAVLDRQPQPA